MTGYTRVNTPLDAIPLLAAALLACFGAVWRLSRRAVALGSLLCLGADQGAPEDPLFVLEQKAP